MISWRILILIATALAVGSAPAATLMPGMQSLCVIETLRQLVPNIEERHYNVNNQVKRFIDHLKNDESFKIRASASHELDHFRKHGHEFQKIGIPIRSSEDYVRSAATFASSLDKNRIVFQSKDGSRLFKVDLKDGRVLVMNPVNHTLITYFVIYPERFQYHSISEYALHHLYLLEGQRYVH